MKIHELRFCERERIERENFEARIAHAEKQSEAAFSLLEAAKAAGQSTTREVAILEYAEDLEASARRDFAKWQRRNIEIARQKHEFDALLGRLLDVVPRGRPKSAF